VHTEGGLGDLADLSRFLLRASLRDWLVSVEGLQLGYQGPFNFPPLGGQPARKKEKRSKKFSVGEGKKMITRKTIIFSKKVTNLMYAGTMAASMAEATPQRFTASEPSSVRRVLFCGSSGWGVKVVVSSVRTCCLKLPRQRKQSRPCVRPWP